MDAANILRQIAISAIPILIAITFHEVAHGYVAYKLGDDTARMMGRLTLNPLAHIDPIGTVLLPAMLLIFTQGQFVFGYAKPVPINPYNFRDLHKGMAISAAAGPATNILLAIASVLLIKAVVLSSHFFPPSVTLSVLKPIQLMLISSIAVNVVLAAFNLLPIPPLDGGRIMVGILPPRQSIALSRLEPYGMFIVIILFVTGLAGVIIKPLMALFMAFLNLLY